MSGYCDCVCPDCFEVAIASDENLALCWECEEAGCDGEEGSECQRPDAYGCGEGARRGWKPRRRTRRIR